MSDLVVKPAKTSGPKDRLMARAQHQLPTDDLPKVRAMALAWRNGLGAVLAGLIGFGLVKGRTDIGELSSPYGVIVGGLLAAAVLAGAFATGMLLRAAHGRPTGASMAKVLANPSDDPIRDAEYFEAESSARALRRGIVGAVGCAFLLVAAVGVTWYGPAKDAERVVVVIPGGERCGDIENLAKGVLTLKTSSGLMEIRLADASGLRTVDSCATPKS
ncbi:hypothetical protein ACIBL3_41020 [Kribbella sp. NPDC050124]|uniref:hypothetical protein n=1 Tax=Kribbella sp. NPDC050124 TaxID=3364114 RepID=UPI0037B520CD